MFVSSGGLAHHLEVYRAAPRDHHSPLGTQGISLRKAGLSTVRAESPDRAARGTSPLPVKIRPLSSLTALDGIPATYPYL